MLPQVSGRIFDNYGLVFLIGVSSMLGAALEPACASSGPIGQTADNKYGSFAAGMTHGLITITGSAEPGVPDVLSLGGVSGLALDEHGRTFRIDVSAAHGKALQDIAHGRAVALQGASTPYRSALLILDDVQVTDEGRKGGYFYQVYLAPRAGSTSAEQALMLGTLGPFEVSAAARQGSRATLRFVLTRQLAALPPGPITSLIILFKRVDGATSPKGNVLNIGEVRIELTTENVQS
jgi:tyrosinase